MTGKRIASAGNPFYRRLRRLAESSQERRREGLSLLDGIHLCQANLAAGGQVLQRVLAASALDNAEVRTLIAAGSPEPIVLADGLFRELSQVSPAVGIIDLIATPQPELPARLDGDAVYLDRIQDPGNVGAILRTCAAAGIGQVLLGEGSAQAWSPKVLRAAMGAHFALELHETLRWSQVFERLAVPIRVATGRAARSLFEAQLHAPALWVFGREGEGVSPEIEAAAAERLAIPQSPRVESLNVVAAAAVCLFEQRRQRLAAAGAGDGGYDRPDQPDQPDQPDPRPGIRRAPTRRGE